MNKSKYIGRILRFLAVFYPSTGEKKIVQYNYISFLIFKVLMKFTQKKTYLSNPLKPVLMDDSKKIIWVFWLQGIENAPQIVKSVVHHNKQLFSDNYNFKVINLEDAQLLVNIPDFIMIKWNAGNISNTQLSDFIRLQLLIEYGGLWIDATVLSSTSTIPKYMTFNSPFMYSTYGRVDSALTSSNWLIYSEADDSLLKKTRDILFRYWEKYNFEIHYLQFYFAFTMVSKKDKKWEEVIRISNNQSGILQSMLFEPYVKEKFDIYYQAADFHKITYKLIDDTDYFSNFNFLSDFDLK